MDRWYLILPLISAFLYAVAAMSQKQAIAAGYGPWRMSALTTWALGIPFVPLIFLEETVSLPDPIWPAIFCGVLFLTGQIFTIIAITKGEVSVATPVMGSKVVIVVLILALFTDDSVGINVWVAAALTTIGIVFLQWEPRQEMRRRVWFTLVMSLISAACFAWADVLVQQGSAEQGFYRFVATSSGVNVILAFGMIPFFRGSLWAFPRGSLHHIWIGSGFISLQAFGLAFAIGYFGDVAGSNVVYSSRGLWGVVLVWVVGHWFANNEKEVGTRTLVMRLMGALLILSAIVLVFL
ncbi:MAG: DMT family transporter [Verrucomicrobiota bacterium]